MKKLKVVVFIPSLGRGGAEQSILTLTSNFIKKGHEVFLIVAKKVPSEEPVPENINVQYLYKKKTVFSINTLRKRLVDIQPDIVLSTLPTSNFLNVLISKSKKFKYKAYIREASTSCLLWDKDLFSRITGVLSKYSFRNATGIIYISKELKEITTNAVENQVSNSITIYNPIVSSDFLAKSSEEIVDPSYDPLKEVWVVGSRLEDYKGVDLLIEAVKRLKDSRNFNLYILGTGSQKTYLEEKSKDLPIIFLDYVDNPLPWYKAADLFFLPSHREGLGNALIEAQLLGTTAIASDCPSGPKEIIQLFNNGITFGVGDLSDLIEKIQSVNIVRKKKVEIDKFNYFDENKVTDEYLKFFSGLSK